MKNNINSERPLLFKIVMLAAGLITGFLVIKIFFLLMTVNTESMSPSVNRGDRVIIKKISSFSKGDIIAFNSPVEDGKILLSRIIASEHETVEIRNRVVFVNDKKIDTSADSAATDGVLFPMKFCHRDNMPPVRIEKDQFFVLADNYNKGFDSRVFGRIPKSSIVGKVIYKK